MIHGVPQQQHPLPLLSETGKGARAEKEERASTMVHGEHDVATSTSVARTCGRAFL